MKVCKKISLLMVALSVLLLTACAGGSARNVETLKNWSFQDNQGTNDYSLFFALADKNGKHMAAEVDVDIRIVNKNEETVYEETKNVTEDDFGYYSRKDEEAVLMAEVRIPANEIQPGSSTEGTVYFTVYKGDYLGFDECNAPAIYCLPVKEITVQAEGLPQEVAVKDYMGKRSAVLRIDSVTCKTEDSLSGDSVTLEIAGQKLSGGESMFDSFGYKVYDSTGYMVESGTVVLQSLSAGDKFKDNSILLFDLTPGECYQIKFEPSKY